ncbi:hypothetical protein C8D76_1123 [Pasteurella langaaensis DSM 22999]|uniref:Uncharacterized protein n=1 Tax=Alitibacter langaaensis DSM 22999 TaxID=1122935 RepID=A0A2U0SMQ8_9PAST|nr:hypothetical protein [Pasteurella langaaensis]PVX32644.1 hypothetical protein C8D76_1123 [Pasteurella langaaensis DSM 22999]
MAKRKKPRITNHSELLSPHRANLSQPNYSIVRFISNLLTTVNIGENMSETGADKAGLEISTGLKFFFKSCGIGVAIAFFLWLSPDFLKALSDFILTLKSN